MVWDEEAIEDTEDCVLSSMFEVADRDRGSKGGDRRGGHRRSSKGKKKDRRSRRKRARSTSSGSDESESESEASSESSVGSGSTSESSSPAKKTKKKAVCASFVTSIDQSSNCSIYTDFISSIYL